MNRPELSANRIHDILSQKAAMGMGYGGITQRQISKILNKKNQTRKQALQQIAKTCNTQKYKKRGRKKGTKMSGKKLTDWQQLVKDYAGSGKSLTELSKIYHKLKGKKKAPKKKAPAKKKGPAKKRGRPKGSGVLVGGVPVAGGEDYSDDIFYY